MDQAVLPSADDCLEFCQDNGSCIWYTYDPADSVCVLLSACPDVFTVDCEGCTFGHRLCQPGIYAKLLTFVRIFATLNVAQLLCSRRLLPTLV